MMNNPKIISVSRRTDIPAFYSEWFINGIERGYVDSINPFNKRYVSRVSLKPSDVICFVFWTKNPKPLMKYLDELDKLGYKYYFQFTLNPYNEDIEKNVPNKSKNVIKTFVELSKKIGREKVIWRYDPILLNDKYTMKYHFKYFEELVKVLKEYTNKVIISFIDLYKKTERNVKGLNIQELSNDTMLEIAERFSLIACRNGLEINTCSESIDLNQFGIKHGKCIDDVLIHKILGDSSFKLNKDKGQRKECGCVESVDIGANNTCKHFCAYCYANTSQKVVEKNSQHHYPNSSLLCGELKGDEEIHFRNGKKSLKEELKRNLFNM